jgi:hypothetical protein
MEPWFATLARPTAAVPPSGALVPYGRRQEFGYLLDDAAVLQAEGPHIDLRGFHSKRRQGGTDLAPMIAPVMQCLGETDTQWRRALVLVVLHEDYIRVGVLCQHS